MKSLYPPGFSAACVSANFDGERPKDETVSGHLSKIQ